MTDANAEAGTAEAKGPVEIDAELARHLENKREELFEKFGIPDEFPDAVKAEAEQFTTDVQSEVDEELSEREDLRDLTTWTTDPVDAQDFDDAVSIERRDEEIVLWVHIADVTHYVRPETAIWESALERANTVYLPGYTVHMLPPILAETVCSLVPNEDRLAHTVEMHLDPEHLGYDSIEIYKSVVRSDARLTYSEAERILDEPETAADLLDDQSVDLAEKTESIWELADRMHDQRKEDGSLVLNPRRDRAHT
ncbi:MAG: RNB domain-containing ribonuclease, partial [Halococcoides sp.]